ncbi:MAG: nucleotidyltransferase family protein [Candidatus Pacebacteria bacterium]|nr:nucleotidyltransferase family protein [Candidatus Paceibacterota bacterium]
MKKKHSLQEIENILRDLKPLLKEQFKVKRIGIFGSYLKGKERKSSDIDILIDFFEEPSFFKFIELEEFLTKKLGVKVDLVIKDTLKPRIKKIILQEILFL